MSKKHQYIFIVKNKYIISKKKIKINLTYSYSNKMMYNINLKSWIISLKIKNMEPSKYKRTLILPQKYRGHHVPTDNAGTKLFSTATCEEEYKLLLLLTHII